jgi:protein transport protein SEC24
VDLWLFNENQHDLASIAPIPTMTGGNIHYYPTYDPVVNGEEVHYALFRSLTRNIGYDCIMTLRLSSGLTLQEYVTGAGRIGVRDLELPIIDADKTISIYFKHEDKINESEAYLQYGLLYTSVYG